MWLDQLTQAKSLLLREARSFKRFKKANGTNLDYLNLINRLFLLFNGMLLMILLRYTEICFCLA